MVPRAMTTIVQEGIEPMLIGTHLLQRIQYKPGMTTVFPHCSPAGRGSQGRLSLPTCNSNTGGTQPFGVAGTASRTATEDSHVICG